MKLNKWILTILLYIILFLFGCNVKDQNEIEGISIFNSKKNYVVDYIPEEKTHLKEIIDDELTNNVIIINKSGKIEILSSDIVIDRNNQTTIVIDEENNKIEDIKGIYLADEYRGNSHAYVDMKSALDNDRMVMAVLLDGFSYAQFEGAMKDNSVPFLSKYFNHEVLSVYTPVTNAGFAAIITGQTPDINGVYNRSFREMKVKSIFDYALKNNKKSVLLEGDIKILNTEIEPELHIDLNKDGDIDDEVFETAKKIVKEGYDLIFIHFHGIDDRGHEFGPMANETMDYIIKIDGYLEELEKFWDGTMIITTDHGMHRTPEGGDHGKVIFEDMVVPYFIKE